MIEKIFSRKKCIYSESTKNNLKFVNLQYIYLQSSNNLSNHKLLFSCNYKTKIYKLCDPQINLARLHVNTKSTKLFIYKSKKLNLLIKTMPTFKYKRLLFIFSDLQQYIKNNIKIYTNTYVDLFLLKSIFFRNYDAMSTDFANDSLFYEYCLDHENELNNYFFFDKIYMYYCRYFFFERFSGIKFNSSCFDDNINIFFNKNLESYSCEDNLNCNNSYDFFFYKTKDARFKNFYFSGHMILFPKNRQEYINNLLGFDDDEINAQNLFFNKYKLIADFFVQIKPYTDDTRFFINLNNHSYILNNYKFLNFFFFLKLHNK